jgi:hypothetical protein
MVASSILKETAFQNANEQLMKGGVDVRTGTCPKAIEMP